MGLMWYLYLSEPPVSHLDTVLPETFNISANCSCVMPFSLRSFFKKFPIFTWSTSTPPFIIKYRSCYLQITRHKARNVVFSLIDTVVYAFFIFSIIQTGNCQILCNRVILIYKLPFSHCIFYKEKQLRSMQK